jgi:putative transposase
VVIHARQKLGVSERRVCSVTGVSRSTMRYQGVPRDDDALRLDLIKLAKQYGRYGYRMIAKLLRAERWHLNHKKVERLWR